MIRNQLKREVRADDTDHQLRTKYEISILSDRIKKLRNDIKICYRIAENEPKIENKLHSIQELTEKEKGKERQENGSIERRSRSNR